MGRFFFHKEEMMPRTVQIRKSYATDVAYLSRLAQAVEKDPRRSEGWKRHVIVLCNRMMMALLNGSYRGKVHHSRD